MRLNDLFSNRNQELEKKATIEIERVAQAINAGQLTERVSLTGLEGSHEIYGKAINQILDAILLPFTITADTIEEISTGVIPPKMDQKAKRFFAIMRSADLSEEECKARLAKLGSMGIEMVSRSGCTKLRSMRSIHT